MKAIIIVSGVVLGLLLGMYNGIEKPKATWWKFSVFFFVILLTVLSFLPPIAANFATSKYLSDALPEYKGNVLVNVVPMSQKFDTTSNKWMLKIWNNIPKYKEAALAVYSKDLPDELKPNSTNTKFVLKLHYDSNKNEFVYHSIASINPILTFPVVPGLEEQIRIMNFHVPVAWISVLAYLFAMIYSISYLKTRKMEYDLKATAAAEIGTIFTILATVTGMIWAKLNWGSFWNWDPRETSIFILLLIYGAYFALRSALENEELKARLSSVYSIIAFITVPFFVFILPRLLSGLHPGSVNDNSSGPVVSTQANTLNFLQQITFSLGFTSISLIFFWMLNIRFRMKKLINHIF